MAENYNLVIEIAGKDYPISGGGGGIPAPNSVGQEELKDNSVGTDEIIDNSVMMDDLNDSVKDTMMTGDDRVSQEDLNNFDV